MMVTTIAAVTTQTEVIERVKLPVCSKDLPALQAFVQMWYDTVFPQVSGFRSVTISSELGALTIEAQWSDREAMDASTRDSRLFQYFSGLQQWLCGWPSISLHIVEA